MNINPAGFQSAINDFKLVLQNGVSGIKIQSTEEGPKLSKGSPRIKILLQMVRDFVTQAFGNISYVKKNENHRNTVESKLTTDWKIINKVVSELAQSTKPAFLLEDDLLYKTFQGEIKTIQAWQKYLQGKENAVCRKIHIALETDWKTAHQFNPKQLQKAIYHITPSVIGSRQSGIPNEAFRISLLDWKQLSHEKRSLVIQRFGLSKSLEEIEKKSNFDQKLKEIDDSILQLLTVADLMKPLTKPSNLHYGLLSNEAFGNLPLREIETLSAEQFKFILERFKRTPPTKHELDETKITQENFFNLSLQDFVSLTGQTISRLFETFKKDGIVQPLSKHSRTLALLKDDQLKELDLTKFSIHELGFALRVHAFSFFFKEADTRQRIAALTDDQAAYLVGKNHLDKLLYYLSDKQIENLDTSKLSQKDISFLFHTIATENIKEEYKSTIQINSQAPEMRYPSKEKIEAISKERLAENKRRFALFSKQQVQGMLDNMTEEQKLLITEKQK